MPEQKRHQVNVRFGEDQYRLLRAASFVHGHDTVGELVMALVREAIEARGLAESATVRKALEARAEQVALEERKLAETRISRSASRAGQDR